MEEVNSPKGQGEREGEGAAGAEGETQSQVPLREGRVTEGNPGRSWGRKTGKQGDTGNAGGRGGREADIVPT